MTNPYRAMCAELADLLERSASVLSTYAFDKLASQGVAAAHRARVLLAQPDPSELTDCITYRELNDLCKEHFPMDEDDIDSLHGLVEAVIAAEREACAQICDKQYERARTSTGAARADACATAIRARRPAPQPEEVQT